MLALAAFAAIAGHTHAQQAEPRGKTSYLPVDITEPFAAIMSRMVAAKPGIERAHSELLTQRYDLADRPAQGVTMSRRKPVQGGVRANGRLLTLEDTVEFFNLVLATKLTAAEKQDLVAFLRAL